MTDDLDKVITDIRRFDWASVKHAYGPASDIPDLLERLASLSNKERDDAWWSLYGNLWHQHTVYEATAHAVPFLVRFLQVTGMPEKHRILVYLADLFLGKSYLDVHQRLGAVGDSLRKDPDFEARKNTELGWVQAVQDEVTKGAETYLELLRSGPAGHQIASAYLLGLIRVTEIGDEVTTEEIERAASE